MSTVPGDDTWADAGLVRPGEAEPPALPEAAAGEHVPDAPRPDRDGQADEGDIVEQAVPAGDDDTDEYPEG